MAERYTHGHFGTVVDDHAQRTAATGAAFLLPHLDTAHRVLDLGCGPGSITLDLADRVASIVGIDAASEAIDRANHDRAERGVGNAEFRVANAYELPFGDARFDIVYAHQVLQHLADPITALVEASRVLVPGGIIAVRDADYGTMIHDPNEPLIDRWLDLYHEAARHNGGEPDAGRMLVRWVTAAGYTEITASTSTWTYTTPAAVEGWRKLWTSRLLDARLGEDLVARGVATRKEVEDIASAFDHWAAAPQPFFAFLHGEVLGRKL